MQLWEKHPGFLISQDNPGCEYPTSRRSPPALSTRWLEAGVTFLMTHPDSPALQDLPSWNHPPDKLLVLKSLPGVSSGKSPTSVQDLEELPAEEDLFKRLLKRGRRALPAPLVEVQGFSHFAGQPGHICHDQRCT